MAQTDQPEDLKYAETHEWVRVDGDEATIGISDYAQDELGDVVYLDLPWDDTSGHTLAQGDHFGDIESVKATSELFLPVGGTIVRVNKALKDHAEQVNSDPYGAGWMIVVKMSNPGDLNKLMSAKEYTQFLGTPGH